MLGFASRVDAQQRHVLAKAAEFKALHSLRLADAWIAACVAEQGATLLHNDPEFEPLEITQELLPLKARSR
jgi:predicted nucleic acid-binding protein